MVPKHNFDRDSEWCGNDAGADRLGPRPQRRHSERRSPHVPTGRRRRPNPHGPRLHQRGLIAASQAQMVDAPALSYGLFHAQVKPNKLYGLVNRGVTFQGLNMDIGHLRHIR